MLGIFYKMVSRIVLLARNTRITIHSRASLCTNTGSIYANSAVFTKVWVAFIYKINYLFEHKDIRNILKFICLSTLWKKLEISTRTNISVAGLKFIIISGTGSPIFFQNNFASLVQSISWATGFWAGTISPWPPLTIRSLKYRKNNVGHGLKQG